MNTEAYIASGVIERYVLGLANSQESAELEQNMELYPEVLQAVLDQQEQLESYATLHAVAPPAALKSSIWAAIQQDSTEGSASFADASDEQSAGLGPQEPRSSGQVVRLLHTWRWVAAASIAVLIGSSLFAFHWMNAYSDLQQDYNQMLQSQHQLEALNRSAQASMDSMKQDMAIITNPNVKPVLLEGVAAHPGMQATVYFDSRASQVYIHVNQLPPAPDNKQYQLWAIIDGKPVDAGMLSKDIADRIQPMKAISGHVQAFAITLEKQGGSPTPTMDQMYVMGKI